MKFLRSEGRVICLLEREDALDTPLATFPKVDLLLVPQHQRHHIENSHLWKLVLPEVRNGLRNVVYF